MLQMPIKCQNIKCGCSATMTYHLQQTTGRPFSIKGILKCGECGHERPLIMYGESINEISAGLPGQQSSKLITNVPKDIKEDVQEAERANYYQCYKASAAMCRRAVQLSLIQKGIKDKGLESMIKEARNREEPLLTNDTYNFAFSIKGFGDIAVHRTEILDPDDIPLLINCTRRMLNELFKNEIEETQAELSNDDTLSH